MADFVTGELIRLLLSMAVGAAFAIVYDVFRIARRAVKHSYAVLSGEDVIFWLAAGVAAFFFFLFLDEGRLRLYTVLGIFAGITVYRMTLGRLLVPFFGGIIRKILKTVTNLLKKTANWYKIKRKKHSDKQGVKKGGKIEKKRKASGTEAVK